MIPVGAASEVVDDLRALPEPLWRAALALMSELRHDAYLGQRLVWKEDPRPAWRLYFDTADAERASGRFHRDPRPQGARCRIVYELLPDEVNPTYIRVLAVGQKLATEDEDIYEKAGRRRD